MNVELVRIPGASFNIGSARGLPDERPVRRVSVAPFLIASRPVSNAEFARFVAATGATPPLHPPAPHPDAPVTATSWFDATAYCAWISHETGLHARLPTEPERELAARGGFEDADWPWGNEPPHERPELAAIAALDHPHVPTTACMNAFGLTCMAENVHEWCQEWRVEGKRRASRGGSFRHAVKFTRVSARSSLDPALRYEDYGFRIAADP